MRGGVNSGWKGSLYGNNPCCLALCEIVGTQSQWQKGSGIYVVNREECVATRFFFVFDNSSSTNTNNTYNYNHNAYSMNLDANSLTLPKDILQ